MRRFLTLGFSLLLVLLAFAVWPRSSTPTAVPSHVSKVAAIGTLFLPQLAIAQAAVDTVDTLVPRGSRATTANTVAVDTVTTATESHGARWLAIAVVAAVVIIVGLWWLAARSNAFGGPTDTYSSDKRT